MTTKNTRETINKHINNQAKHKRKQKRINIITRKPETHKQTGQHAHRH